MDVYDLQPVNGRKSFYGKAKVFCFKNKNGGYFYLLRSYNTPICSYDTTKGEFTKFYDGKCCYSQTTLTHVSAFVWRYTNETYSKQWYVNLPCKSEELPTILEMMLGKHPEFIR